MAQPSDPVPPPPLPAGSMPASSIDDIRYLIVFAKVAEAGSFSRAAAALGLGTATTSQHVSRLEARLGSALLYRNTRKLSLTVAGERLLETARAMLALYEEGLPQLGDTGSKRQRLRVAMPAFLHRSSLMPALAAFMRTHPDVELRLHSSENRHDLIGESIDLAFRAGELADSGLRARQVFSVRRQTVAAPELLRAHPVPERPADLAKLPWIGLSMRPHQRSYSGPTGVQEHFVYTPSIIVDSVEAAFEFAKLGLGLAAPPDFLLRDDPQASELVRLLPQWSLAPLLVHAVWPANLSRHSLGHRLVDAVCGALAGAGTAGAQA